MNEEVDFLVLDDEKPAKLPSESTHHHAVLDEQTDLRSILHRRRPKVIVLDFNLETSGSSSPFLQQTDGASLVGHLRSLERGPDNAELPPLVILTNEENAFKNEVPHVGPQVPLNGSFRDREHQLAPVLDVEWLLYKEDDRVAEKLASLLEAAKLAPSVFQDNGSSPAEIATFLGLPSKKSSWAEVARERLPRSRPPVSQSTTHRIRTGGGTRVIRWLAHRVLPYPGLLSSDVFAAWTLGVDVESFRRAVEAERATPWVVGIKESDYSGALAKLFERRWWTAGIEAAAAVLSDEIFRTGSRQAALDALCGEQPMRALTMQDPVVFWKPELSRELGIIDIEDALQIHPPGWPAECDEPWLSKEEVLRDDLLKSMSEEADHGGEASGDPN